jgi:peptide/nickel transport system ATP-binding protein
VSEPRSGEPADAAPDAPPLLEVRDLTVAFGRRAEVLHRVSFTVGTTQRLGLIGESGSGKSVTALAVMGLLDDNARAEGSVRLNGREILNRPDAELSRIRGEELGMVFQEPMTALDPTMKVGRQVAEVVRLHRRAGTADGVTPTRRLVLEMLAAVELTESERIANSYPHQLSGGQRQRVVLAMALINSPDLLICDEPTTALDVTVQARVLAVLDAALTRERAACLFISHDLAVVSQVCTDVLVMLDGSIVDAGPVEQVLGRPQHPYTAGLVATARLDAIEPGERLPVLDDFYPAAGRLARGADGPADVEGTGA